MVITSSNINYIDSLLDIYSWTGNIATSSTVNYSFANSTQGGTLLNSTQQATALAIMNQWSNIANVTFNAAIPSIADLTFSTKSLGSASGVTGVFYSGSIIAKAEVIIDNNFTNADFSSGKYAYFTMVHEIGHSLGLKHSGNYGSSDIAPFLPSSEDNYDASIMSYIPGNYTTNIYPPTGPMIYDIAAIQYIYGANTNYNNGANTYSYDGIAYLREALWDGGGSDTLSSEAYISNVTLDINEGLHNVTTIGNTVLWMAFGANIENAISGAGNDIVKGNVFANILNAGAGNDTIYGGGSEASAADLADVIYGGNGLDLLYGNGGNDTIYGGIGDSSPDDSADIIYGGSGIDSLYGNGGNDTIYGGGGNYDRNASADTIFGGQGADAIYGNGGDDSLYGGGANYNPTDLADNIYGGAGNDYILANGGNDIIYGGGGNDSLHGGQGNDVYVFANSSGADVILKFDAAGAATGDIIQIENNINSTGIVNNSDILSHISYSNGNATIDLGNGNILTINDIAVDSFTIDDFSVI